MKVFCTQCGSPQDVPEAQPQVTCAACGNVFAPAQWPSPANAAPSATAGGPSGPASGKAAKGLSGWVIGLIVAGVSMIPCIGVLAAIAIPSFTRYVSRSHQVECQAQLKSWYLAQRGHFADTNTFSPSLDEVGWWPERGNRYAYFADVEGAVEERTSAQARPSTGVTGIGVDVHRFPKLVELTLDDVPSELAGERDVGVMGNCPECSITMACVGNLDGDTTLDVWSISTDERLGPEGVSIPAGVPFHEVDDVKN